MGTLEGRTPRTIRGALEGLAPVLIVGLGVHGLAIARSLGRRGVAVEAVEADARQPHRFSRYCRHSHAVDSIQDERLVDHLVRLGQRAESRTALFITRDRTVPIVSAHREVLKEYFDFTLPPHSVVEELMHKGRVTRFLQRSGSRYPRTVQVEAPQELRAAGDAVGFPCILKPSLRSEGFKAGIARSSAELTSLYAAAAPHCQEFVLQQWIRGADSDVYFAFGYLGRDGKAKGLFVGRKLRQYPRGTGIAAEAEGCDDEFVRGETLRLFDLAGYRGFGSIEFRRDPATGAYYLIEFTVGRTDYNVACAVANGVDLPWLGYRDTVGHGHQGSLPCQSNDRRWVDVARRAKAIAEERRETGGSRLRTFAQIAAGLAPTNSFTLFDFRDVRPFLAHVGYRLRALALAIPRKLRTLIATAPWSLRRKLAE